METPEASRDPEQIAPRMHRSFGTLRGYAEALRLATSAAHSGDDDGVVLYGRVLQLIEEEALRDGVIRPPEPD